MLMRSVVTISILLVCFHTTQPLPFVPPELRDKLGDALEAIFSMGVRLQVLLEDPKVNNEENFLISPLSAALVIGQLMLGAEGEFREHLYQLMSLPPTNKHILSMHPKDGENVSMPLPHSMLHVQLSSLYRQLKRTPSRLFTLKSTNALFLNRNLQLQKEFSYLSRLLYETELYSVDFNNPKDALYTVNHWAESHTNGLIKQIMAAPPGPYTSGIFANAIYFLGEWEQPFSSELNIQSPFYITKDKPTSTLFMTGLLEGVPYAESKVLGCKMMVLPYKNRELGMYIILPNAGHRYEYDIRRFASDANVSDILDMVENLKDRDVVVKIPKMSLSTSVSILEPLQKYAAYKKVVKNMANQGNVLDDLEKKITNFQRFKPDEKVEILLTNATENSVLRISNILQQMTFAINEKGTEAAAITASIMDYNGGSKGFLANKPFMFFIRHEATAATLFWGTISNPNA